MENWNVKSELLEGNPRTQRISISIDGEETAWYAILVGDNSDLIVTPDDTFRFNGVLDRLLRPDNYRVVRDQETGKDFIKKVEHSPSPSETAQSKEGKH